MLQLSRAATHMDANPGAHGRHVRHKAAGVSPLRVRKRARAGGLGTLKRGDGKRCGELTVIRNADLRVAQARAPAWAERWGIWTMLRQPRGCPALRNTPFLRHCGGGERRGQRQVRRQNTGARDGLGR